MKKDQKLKVAGELENLPWRVQVNRNKDASRDIKRHFQKWFRKLKFHFIQEFNFHRSKEGLRYRGPDLKNIKHLKRSPELKGCKLFTMQNSFCVTSTFKNLWPDSCRFGSTSLPGASAIPEMRFGTA